MTKVPINGQEYYFDGYLVQNLDLLKKRVEKDWDGLIYIGGYEGDGKSEFTSQMAYYLDPTYNIDRCVFTPRQFLDAVDKATQYQAIVYDEAQDVMDSNSYRDPIARLVKSKLTRIRKKNLFIFVVAPDYWRINKYLFIHRSLAFARVYSDGLERGYFAFYNRERKHELYIKGKREENMNVVDPNFRGRFTHWFPLDKEQYEAKKDAAEQEALEARNKEEKNQQQPLSADEKLKAQATILKWLSVNNWLKKGGSVAASKFFLKVDPRTYRQLGAQEKELKDLSVDYRYKKNFDEEDLPLSEGAEENGNS